MPGIASATVKRLACCALFVVIYIFAVLVATPPARAQTLDFAQVDSYIHDLMSIYQIPGAALALVKDGEIVYAKGYGVRNARTGQPVTENTLFSIGSISKSFTALAVAQLAESGKLTLDDHVIKYLPDFRLADPHAASVLTIGELLTQTSGLPRADDLWWPGAPASRQQIVRDLRKVSLISVPGQQFHYSNQNYVLLGYLIERLTGQTWEDYVRQHILEPLNMAQADFDVPAMQAAPDHAEPHILDERAGTIPIAFNDSDKQWLSTHGPAVSINASILDMARYVQAQLGGSPLTGSPVISTKMLSQMHSPLTDFAPLVSLVSNQGYAMGWFTETYRDQALVEHSGDVKGFAANVTLVPSAHAGVVLLTNTQVVETFRQAVRLRMVEMLLGLKAEHDIAQTLDQASQFDPVERLKQFQAARTFRLDAATLRQLPGDYDGSFGRTHIDLQGDRLFARRVGWLVVYEMAGFAPGQLLCAAGSITDSLVMTFKIDKSGAVTFYQDDRQVLARVRSR
jgi:CubicO group peptidase (beta-lactamase class C family)